MKISVTGIDAILNHIERIEKSLDENIHSFLEKLAEVGIKVAVDRFATAEYSGLNDVTVDESPEWIDEHTFVITARGQAVTFIEFGAGVHYSEQHPKATELGFQRGTYGKGKGSQNVWGYYGEPGNNAITTKETKNGTLVLTHGNPPARAMYESGKEMRQQIEKIAKEVFGND